MGMGTNCGQGPPLVPTIELLWHTFAQLDALCLWT